MEPLRISSQEAIARAAREIFALNPSAALADVAAKAGVGRATLHRHYASRSELVRTIAIEALDRTDEACAGIGDAPNARAALTQLFDRLGPLGDRYGFLYRVRIDDTEINERYAAQVESLHDLVEWLRRDGEIAEDVPAAWLVALIDQVIWTTWQLVANGEMTARAVSTLATRTVLGELRRTSP